jgi:hypothetical protein
MSQTSDDNAVGSTSDDNAVGSTGDVRVDAVVARLDDLDGLDLTAQLEVFGELHASLVSVLDGVPEPDDSSANPTLPVS